MTETDVDQLESIKRLATYDPSLVGVNEIMWIIARLEAAEKFKAYVHRRLDEAGVPTDPDSPHKAEGCRIGGRLDIMLAWRECLRWAYEIADAESTNEEMLRKCRAALANEKAPAVAEAGEGT